MKAKLYINSEKSTIKVEGGPSDVLHLLACAIAQILKSYFPDDFERQMGYASKHSFFSAITHTREHHNNKYIYHIEKVSRASWEKMKRKG